MKFFFALFIALCIVVMETFGGEGFYNIAHMTNTIQSVDWAVAQGANSVEIDLQFKDDGTPYKFFHVKPCDCSCMCLFGNCGLFPNGVCVQLQKSSNDPCLAKTDVKLLLNYIARKNMAMVVIDSKLTDQGKNMNRKTQRNAAKKVITLLETELFRKGFRGQVIIGAPYFQSLPFITEIAKTTSQYKRKIHFTIDREDMADTKTKLDFQYNKNVVYNVGLSACSPTDPAKAKAKLAMLNKRKGVWGMTYTWTVDKKSTMTYYINYFNGIITNYPQLLKTVLKEQGMKLATPSDEIPPATSSNTITYGGSTTCECTYSSGGCQVTKKAPNGLACQCTYPFLWTCSGWIVFCRDMTHPKCKKSDLSKESCLQGRGDCGAY